MRMKTPVTLGLVALIGCLLTVAARAEVRDSTGTFSRTAIDQADATIRQIKQISGRDVIVEVFPQLPADKQASYSPAAQKQFFENWASSRANELGVNGIYVLVCRNPSYLEAQSGQRTQQAGVFSRNDSNQLAQIMLGQFKNRNFDGGLAQGMNFILDQVKQHKSSGAAVPAAPVYHSNLPANPGNTSSGHHWWLWLLIIVGGIFLVRAFLRRRAAGYAAGGYGSNYSGGANPGAYPPAGYGAPATGGLGRGMMGGLLGGMAGGWLYDKFRGHGGGTMGSGGNAYGVGQSPADMSDQGQGFSGSGGSFDSGGGGGGDFSGGGGGGDFGGGGDSGGGGSF